MIQITFKPNTMELEINGHASHGKKGEDIVCSAVSTLFYTLAETLYQSTEMLSAMPIVKTEDGVGYIWSNAKPPYEGNVQMMYMTVLNGLRMVAENYPKNVSFRVKE